ncbi:MAG: hypothetical protein ACXV5D_10150 [Halobacteriota archaeon]
MEDSTAVSVLASTMAIVATMMAQRNRTSVRDRRYEEIGAENWRLASRGRCTKAEGR